MVAVVGEMIEPSRFSTSFEVKIDQGHVHLGLGARVMLALDEKMIGLARRQRQAPEQT